MTDIIIKKDGKKWIRFNLKTGKFEEPHVFGLNPEGLLDPEKYYIIKEEELK